MSYEKKTGNLTLTGKLILSGSTVYFESTDGTINVEAPNGITLDGNLTYDTGHTVTYSNDGTSASGNYTKLGCKALVSGNVCGYIPVTIGTSTLYLLAWSGAAITA